MQAKHPVNFEAIPVIDFNQLFTHRDVFIASLREVCHRVGFFYLINHGVPSALQNAVLQQTKNFFALPQSQKELISIAHSPHYRGYGKLNAETTEGISDFKETYDLGLEVSARHVSLDAPYYVLQGPNQWPSADSLPHFKNTILNYMSAMQQLGCAMMEVMMTSLGVSSQRVSTKFTPDSDDAYAMLRLLHYPPGGNKLGVGPHVDAGFLVFLLQDEVGGLQVQNHHGDWIDAPSMPDAFIVNIGEMLQVWSGGYFQATPHRVINASNKNRISAPFFFEPHLSSVITPLDNPDLTPRVLYGERILAIFKRSFQ